MVGRVGVRWASRRWFLRLECFWSAGLGGCRGLFGRLFVFGVAVWCPERLPRYSAAAGDRAVVLAAGAGVACWSAFAPPAGFRCARL